jgi:hypothetical protein
VRSLSGLAGLGLPAHWSPFRVVYLAGGLLLAGCTSPEGPNGASVLDGLFAPAAAGPEATPPRTHEADRTSCGSAVQCKGVLKTMIDSPDRGWIGKQQSPSAYANGTRLFAYRALRTRLTCNELALAVEEVRAASKSLERPVPGMTPDQLSRTRALSVQVEGELARERTGRCRT